MPRISPVSDLIALSPVPDGVQISPHTHEFRAAPRRIADVRDSVAERDGFELSVPLSPQEDGGFQAAACRLREKAKILLELKVLVGGYEDLETFARGALQEFEQPRLLSFTWNVERREEHAKMRSNSSSESRPEDAELGPVARVCCRSDNVVIPQSFFTGAALGNTIKRLRREVRWKWAKLSELMMPMLWSRSRGATN